MHWSNCPEKRAKPGKERSNAYEWKSTLRQWQRRSGEAVAGLMLHLPPEKHAAVQKLIDEVSDTYQRCLAWAAVSPESLEHRTKQLIENPRLPGPVLTHPVNDDSVWSQWEAKEADKRRIAMEEETSKFLRECNRNWSKWNREMDQIQASRPRGTLFFALPGGGGVATDGRSVYVTPKPGRQDCGIAAGGHRVPSRAIGVKFDFSIPSITSFQDPATHSIASATAS